MRLKKTRLDARFYSLLFLVGILTFLVHEFSHWIMGTSLGHEMLASPNRVWSKGPISPTHGMLVSAAGPAITIVQGLIGFWLVRSRASLVGFAMLYMAFFSRLLAAAVSVLNPNDEARISAQLGIGTWTLPILVVAGLFALVYLASRHLKLSLRQQFFCYVTASIAVTLVVGADYLFVNRA